MITSCSNGSRLFMTRCMPIASKRLSKTHLANAPRTSETFEETASRDEVSCMPLRNKNYDADQLSDYSLHTENPSKGRNYHMEKKFCMKALCSELVFGLTVLAFVSLAGTARVAIAAQGKLDSAKIEQLTGMKGEMNEKEGVLTVRGPSTDLQVTTD